MYPNSQLSSPILLLIVPCLDHFLMSLLVLVLTRVCSSHSIYEFQDLILYLFTLSLAVSASTARINQNSSAMARGEMASGPT